MQTRMGTYESLLEALRHVAENGYGNITKMAESLDFPQSVLSKMLNRKSRPRIDTVCGLLDAVGAKIVFPGDEDDQATGCLTPEAAHIDRWISKMREGGKPADESAICAFVLKELEAQFSKSSPQASEERKLAS